MNNGEEELWYTYDMSNKRDYITCVNHLQKAFRATLEYDDWQRKCKYEHATECPVCDDNYYDKNLKCESHHHPKKLSVIIEEILDTHLEDNDLDNKSGFDIMLEIMNLHMKGQVSYINLCVHCHKKYHSQHPDVVNKIYEIFDKWALQNQQIFEHEQTIKEANESVPELVETLAENIDTISIDLENKMSSAKEEVIEIKELQLDTIEIPDAPIIEVLPKVVHYETPTGFEEVLIDITEFE